MKTYPGSIDPNHYKKGKLEVINILKEKLSVEEYRGLLRGSMLQYLFRYREKNGIEDLEKAQWYLKKLIALEKEVKDETSKHCTSEEH